MARRDARDPAERTETLRCERTTCLVCNGPMVMAYHNDRRVMLLSGSVRFMLKIRQCRNVVCAAYKKPYRPEAEGAIALPRSEYGLDILAVIGALRYVEHRSVPEIHAALKERGVDISARGVTDLMYRYEELISLRLTDAVRLRDKLLAQGRVILALDGLQPDVGHEVLWVLRDVLSGEVLLARALLGGGQAELTPLVQEVLAALGPTIPIVGVISDGQHAIRHTIASVLPGVPHQLCQFHFLREAAGPVFEADRHAKVQLKKELRGIRGIERSLEARVDDEAKVLRGYCQAVRSSLTDDGRPPLMASGLRLKQRIEDIEGSLSHVVNAKRGRIKTSAES
jgi:hypothetical protein